MIKVISSYIKGLNGHSEMALYVDTFEEVDATYMRLGLGINHTKKKIYKFKFSFQRRMID